MEKIPTLFQRNPADMKLVTRDINPDAAWLFEVAARPSVKRDGTNIRATVQSGQVTIVEKRRNPTREKKRRGQNLDIFPPIVTTRQIGTSLPQSTPQISQHGPMAPGLPKY